MGKTPAALLDPTTFDGPSVEESDELNPAAQVAIKGRNVEVPDHFRRRILTKLARLERLDSSIMRFEVELRHEKNPRQSKSRQRVEITCRGKGIVARAEAGEDTFYAALESAIAKLERRLRKVRTKKRISHTGHRRPQSVAEATAGLAVDVDLPGSSFLPGVGGDEGDVQSEIDADEVRREREDDGPGHIVRTKVHTADPMTVDDALSEIELVGHDFYLFRDVETGKATVVYRRHAYDYGLITLAE